MFTVVVPILNQFEEAAKYLESWFALSKSRLNVLFIDNNSDEPWGEQSCVARWLSDGHNIRVIRNEKNVGVYPTFQQGLELCPGHGWLFFSHSDVEMMRPGWDQVLASVLEVAGSRNAGACGMFGAKGIGTPGIYHSPYDYRQLQRWECRTVESMMHGGSSLIDGQLEQVMVLDGFSLILSRPFLDRLESFDYERYPCHHMYDNDICLESHFRGFRNFAIDIDCIHHGGMTSTREKWAEGMGTTDHDVHRAAHVVFYEKWRGRLPVGVQ